MVTNMTLNLTILIKKTKVKSQFGQLDFQKERIFTIDVFTVSQSFVKTWVVSLVSYTYLARY